VIKFAALIVFGAIAWAAGFIGNWLIRAQRARIVMNRFAGTVFMGLALHK